MSAMTDMRFKWCSSSIITRTVKHVKTKKFTGRSNRKYDRPFLVAGQNRIRRCSCGHSEIVQVLPLINGYRARTWHKSWSRTESVSSDNRQNDTINVVFYSNDPDRLSRLRISFSRDTGIREHCWECKKGFVTKSLVQRRITRRCTHIYSFAYAFGVSFVWSRLCILCQLPIHSEPLSNWHIKRQKDTNAGPTIEYAKKKLAQNSNAGSALKTPQRTLCEQAYVDWLECCWQQQQQKPGTRVYVTIWMAWQVTRKSAQQRCRRTTTAMNGRRRRRWRERAANVVHELHRWRDVVMRLWQQFGVAVNAVWLSAWWWVAGQSENIDLVECVLVYLHACCKIQSMRIVRELLFTVNNGKW